MRQSLFVFFLLAILPAVAKAAPFAEYNPATGDVTLRELAGLAQFQFTSKNGLLNKTIAAQPPIYSPSSAVPPDVSDTYINGPGFLLRWSPAPGESQFKFNSLTILQAVQPHTPHSNELQFGVRFVGGEDFFFLRELRVIPEPSAFALGSISILSLAALRRRK